MNSRKLKAIIILVIVLSFFHISSTKAASTSLFFDGFENNSFSNWDTTAGTNFALSGGTCRMGPDTNLVALKTTGGETPHNQILAKAVSTFGYENISISFCYKWDVLENSDALIIEYTTDGVTWKPVKTIDNSTVDHMMYAADDTEIATSNGVGEIPTPFNVTLEQLANRNILLPADASNQPNFALRLREQMTDGNDFVWIDDIRISGDAITIVPPPPSTNLIANPTTAIVSSNPALPQDWFLGGWGNNTRILTYPVSGSDDNSAVKVEITAFNSGDAKWYFKEVPVTAGMSYTFSNWFMSNIPSYVAVQYKMANGTYTYDTLSQEAASSTLWQNTQTNFTIPENVVAMTIFHLIKQEGYLTTDNYSLTPLGQASQFDTGKISLTFDDGWESIFANAIPILDAAGLKSTQYIVSGLLDTPGYMTPANVLAMQFNGHDIAGHTVTHPNLLTQTPDQLRTEIGGGRRDLVLIGAAPMNSFAYPEGDYNDAIKNVVRESGYLVGRGVELGFNNKNSDRYALKVQQVNNDTTVDQVQSWIDQALAEKTWLILLFHGIDYSGSTYSSTPETLEQVTNYLTVKNAPVITVSEGLSLLNPQSTLPIDAVKPIITLTGPSTLTINNGSTYVDAGATAFDNIDGDLTVDLIQTGNVNTLIDGIYTIHYNVTDLAQNVALQATRTITVTSPTDGNLVTNPSMEIASSDSALPQDWSKGGWGTNTRVLTYPVTGNNSSNAIKVEITSYNNGDAKWYFKEIPVLAGQTYTFSDSYKSNIPSYVAAQYKMVNGTYTYADIMTTPSSKNAWQTAQKSFTVPANATSLTIFHLIKKVGSLTIDNMSITQQ